MSQEATELAGNESRLPPWNPETRRKFRRESWWQIIFPVVLVAVLSVTGLVLLLVFGKKEGASIVADYSLVLLIILSLIAGLLVLAAVAAAAYGVGKAIPAIPPYTGAVQNYTKIAYEWVDAQTDRLANLVITVKSTLAGVMHFLKSQTAETTAKPEEASKDTDEQ
nr:hypothetical protein [Anaerolineae bacterium]